MSALDPILAAARARPAVVSLAEGEDPRIVEGAVRAARDGIARPVLVGAAAPVRTRLDAMGGADVAVVDPVTDPRIPAYADLFREIRKRSEMSDDEAREAVRDPLTFAALMVRAGDAEGTMAGAVATTAETVRTAFRIIGRAEGVETVSSFFLMLPEGDDHPLPGPVLFADCGLVIDPSSEELAQIALSSAGSLKALLDETARIAFLSFSTHGSARHERVNRVTEALGLAREMRPDLLMDGELQFDAAFVPEVAASKAPASPLKGNANIFVFPSLESANIGYKIAQRIGRARAIGPILQGLAAPANDLSRGCSAQDVYDLIAVTGAQAAGQGG